MEKQLIEAKSNNELIGKIEELLENGAAGNSNDELLLQILAALERLELRESIDKGTCTDKSTDKLLERHRLATNHADGDAFLRKLNATSNNNNNNEDDETAAMSAYWLTDEDALKVLNI